MTNNNTANSSLLILTWNANGLKQHKDEFLFLLQDKNINIALIYETHFTSNSCINIHEYKAYFACYPDGTSHVGAALYIKSNSSHYPLLSYIFPHIQAFGVSILSQNNVPINTSAIYSPPGLGITVNLFSDYFSTLSHRFVSGGDFNSKNPKWGNRSRNTRGWAFFHSITNNNLLALGPPKSTYWPSFNNRLPGILDFFVYKLPSNIHSIISKLHDLSSDQTPILLEIGLNPSIPKRETLTPDRMNWSIFKSILNDNINLKISLKTTDEIDVALESLSSSIQNASLTASISKTNHTMHNKIPHHIQVLLAEKRKARANW
jgi:hypothetical protein